MKISGEVEFEGRTEQSVVRHSTCARMVSIRVSAVTGSTIMVHCTCVDGSDDTSSESAAPPSSGFYNMSAQLREERVVTNSTRKYRERFKRTIGIGALSAGGS